MRETPIGLVLGGDRAAARSLRQVALASLLGVVGCGVPAGVKTPDTAQALLVHAVPWAPGALPGPTKMVADLGADVVVFSDGAATVVTDGSIANVDRRVPSWVSATTIPAPDGSGLWIVGVDANGQIWRLRARKSFEPISERYGLSNARVTDLCGFGGRFVGFSIADARAPFAVANGSEVARYSTSAVSVLGGGSGMLGALTGDGVWTFDARTSTARSYALRDARDVAVDEQGTVFVATSRAIYSMREDGTLLLRYASRGLHGLVASHDHVWFADGPELGVLDGDTVRRTRAADVPEDATLTGSPSGDVWALSRGALTRYAIGESPSTGARVRWEDAAGPVFGRVCSRCHASDSTSGVDLSTPDAWRKKRDLIRQRVLVDRDMPPREQPIADLDRESVKRWLDSPAL